MDTSPPRRRPGTPHAGRRARLREAAEALQRIFQHIEQYSRRSLRDHGVTGPQAWALQVLLRKPDLPVGDLAQEMYLHISSASSLADLLEGRGLVVRRRDAADRRQVHLHLTATGVHLARRLRPPPRSRIPRALSSLPDPELRSFLRSLAGLSRAMGVGADPAVRRGRGSRREAE